MIGLEEQARKNPASFQGYKIEDHITKIDNLVKNKLKSNDNNIDKIDLSIIYNKFNTLDKLINRTELTSFVSPYIKGTDIYIPW